MELEAVNHNNINVEIQLAEAGWGGGGVEGNLSVGSRVRSSFNYKGSVEHRPNQKQASFKRIVYSYKDNQ